MHVGPVERVEHTMVLENHFATLRLQRRIKVGAVAAYPENLIVQPELKTRMHRSHVVETVLIHAVRRKENLDATSARPIEKPLQICFQIELFDHRTNLSCQFTIFCQEVVQDI